MEQNPKQQVVERIKAATNILVTVSTNPSVDQLAACIGFTLMLNKLGKHATAVFSGVVPSTLEFLQPEKTIETTTDSLQDFIIALDKSKADKLRYKVEDDVVRIFITPYRTAIGEKDLVFSLGDFNVDVVVALGVMNKEEIDQAIVAHGRILHDAVVMTVSKGETISNVGSINWNDPAASSLSEMLVSISESFQSGLLDPQMSTSFLTGIVAETDRFSNEKTSPKVMTMSAQLMAAGANQQLIATKLAPPPEPPAPVVAPTPETYQEVVPVAEPEPSPEVAAPESPKNDGEIDIPHEHEGIGAGISSGTTEVEVDEDEIHIDADGNLKKQAEMLAAKAAAERAEQEAAAAKAADERAAVAEDAAGTDEAPVNDNSFINNSAHTVLNPLPGQSMPDPLLPQPSSEPALDLPPLAPTEPPAAPAAETQDTETLAQLENEVDSPHVSMVDSPAQLDDARQAVATAGLDTPPRPEAVQSLGSQPLGMDLNTPASPSPSTPQAPVMTGVSDILQATSSSSDPLEASTLPTPPPPPTVPTPEAEDPLAPPPVPPPMTMPYFEPKTSHHNPYLNPNGQPGTDEPQDQV